jgi:ribulose 1,5-bisphosphate synthetase/thiazole synthase
MVTKHLAIRGDDLKGWGWDKIVSRPNYSPAMRHLPKELEQMTKISDVLVIGGGLHGLSAALHLARDGARVRLVEQAHIGRHASGVNAGGVG